MEFSKVAARTARSILALIAILQFSLFGPAVGSINADNGPNNSNRTALPIAIPFSPNHS